MAYTRTNYVNGTVPPINDDNLNNNELQTLKNSLRQDGGGEIINGNFDHWQRGTSFSSTFSNDYITDRFAITTTKLSGVIKSTDVPADIGASNSLKTATTIADTVLAVWQDIENPNNIIENKETTVSFWAKSTIAQTLSVVLRNVTQAVNYQIINYNITTSWQKFEITFNAVGGWLIDDVIRINLSNNNISSPSDVIFSQVKFEIGDVGTDFIPRTEAEELRDCRRYYFSSTYNDSGTTSRLTTGQCFSATTAGIIVNFPEQMRIAPTFATTGNFAVSNATGIGIAVTSLTQTNLNVNAAELDAVVAAGLVAGNATILRKNADATADLTFDAEL